MKIAKSKNMKPVIEFLKTLAAIAVITVIGITLGLLLIAADMKENPTLSGVSPEKSVAEIAIDLAEDVLSA